jgi:hypothetical protein
VLIAFHRAMVGAMSATGQSSFSQRWTIQAVECSRAMTKPITNDAGMCF